MERQDIVVIGASAGGIQALITLLGGLPADLPAAIFVVVHIPPYSISRLPEILGRAGPLPAAHAVHGEAIRPSRIYVAPPNRHLLVRRDQVEVTGGPRENHVRPAVDPLVRSAARAYGQRVVGVVLSGSLYDGSAGLLAVKGRGGVAIVQDPDDAAVDSMPRNASALVEADYTAGAAAIAPILVELTRRSTSTGGGQAMADEEERLEVVIRGVFAEQANDQRAADTTIYTCPDCGGGLVARRHRGGAPLPVPCRPRLRTRPAARPEVGRAGGGPLVERPPAQREKRRQR